MEKIFWISQVKRCFFLIGHCPAYEKNCYFSKISVAQLKAGAPPDWPPMGGFCGSRFTIEWGGCSTKMDRFIRLIFMLCLQIAKDPLLLNWPNLGSLFSSMFWKFAPIPNLVGTPLPTSIAPGAPKRRCAAIELKACFLSLSGAKERRFLKWFRIWGMLILELKGLFLFLNYSKILFWLRKSCVL
jgi:hypothetical protein